MKARDTLLVTGAAGFIGSHFARLASETGSQVIALDDLSAAGSWPVLPADVVQVRGDFADWSLLTQLLAKYRVTAVVHFAGKICVGESVAHPAVYYDHNVTRALALLDVIKTHGPPAFVFSSSAAVYGGACRTPISEWGPCQPLNPYGATKLAFEQALRAYGTAYGLRWVALRYFNAAGAHPDGTLAERHDPETHLIPLAIDAALGRRRPLTIFGSGSAVRDYVHVQDLARAHLRALDALDDQGALGPLNLGSARGHTVREVLDVCGRVIGTDVPFTTGTARAGDPSRLIADIETARETLGWSPERKDLETIVEDALRSRKANMR